MENLNNNQTKKHNDSKNIIKQNPFLYNYVITEKDMYPQMDNRSYQCGIEDIEDGDNFEDYAKYFFNTYGDEIFDN